MLSLSFTPFNHIANLMRLNMPYDYDTLIVELEKEDWEKSSREDIGIQWPGGGRSKLDYPASPILRKIIDYLRSSEAKKAVIENLYETIHQLPGRWNYWTAERMFANTTLHGELTRDAPGFVQQVHLDSKILVATGMIYLTPHQDVNWETAFHSSKEDDATLQYAPSDFGNGWMHMNDWDSWHSGGNRTDQMRYTILVPLTLAASIKV